MATMNVTEILKGESISIATDNVIFVTDHGDYREFITTRFVRDAIEIYSCKVSEDLLSITKALDLVRLTDYKTNTIKYAVNPKHVSEPSSFGFAFGVYPLSVISVFDPDSRRHFTHVLVVSNSYEELRIAGIRVRTP